MPHFNFSIPDSTTKNQNLDQLALKLADISYLNFTSGATLCSEISPALCHTAGLKVKPRLIFGSSAFYAAPMLGIPEQRDDVLALTRDYLDYDGQITENISEVPGIRSDLLHDTKYYYASLYSGFIRNKTVNPDSLVPFEFQTHMGVLSYPVQWEGLGDQSNILNENDRKYLEGNYSGLTGQLKANNDYRFLIDYIPEGRLRTLLVLIRTKHWSVETSTAFNTAIEIAEIAHREQFRKATGAPYLIHPLEIASFGAALIQDQVLSKGLILHDVPEDGVHALIANSGNLEQDRAFSMARHKLVMTMGQETADFIMDLTKAEFDVSKWPYTKYSELDKGQNLYNLLVRSMSDQITLSQANKVARVRLGKLIDRLYNLRDWDGIPIKSAYGQLHETLHFIFPAVEISLKKDLTDPKVRKNDIIKATEDVLDLLRWQWLCSAVNFYKACKLRGIEPPNLHEAKDLRDTLESVKKEKVAPI
jgi:hypothetical protein